MNKSNVMTLERDGSIVESGGKYYKKPSKQYNKKPRKQSAMSVANKALYLARKNQYEKELKFVAGHEVFDVPWGNGIVWPIGRNAQGTGNNEHIGNTINPTSARFKLLFDCAETTRIRVMCFIWKDDFYAGTSGGASGILDTDLLANYYQQESVISFKNDTNSTKSRILYDEVFTFSPGTSLEDYKEIILKNLPKEMVYADSAATTYFKKNGLYIALVSDQPTGATVPQVEFYTRLYFKDS